MKIKKIAIAVSMACAGLAISPATWAQAFPGAGVDNVQSLAKFKVTFTKKFAIYLRDNKGAPLCKGKTVNNCPESMREYVPNSILYERNTKIGRSDPHQDGDGTDELWGADVCVSGSANSCNEFGDYPVVDADFQWEGTYEKDKHPFDEGPIDRWEVHTQVLSFNLKPLYDRSANAIRAGDQAPCQARSLGEVESLNGNGFPAESVFHMYVEVDVDWDNNGTVDMVVFNERGNMQQNNGDKEEPTHVGGDPLVIESTGLRRFPPQVIYQHTGRTARTYAPKLFVRGTGCSVDKAFTKADGTPEHIGWLRIATHGIDFKPADNIKKGGQREGNRPDQCQEGETEIECFDRFFNSLPMMPIDPEEVLISTDPELVEIDFFSAVAVGKTVALSWKTVSEIDNAGFYIWRAKKADEGEIAEYTLPDGTGLVDIKKRISKVLIPTQGVSTPYSYVDNSDKVTGTYFYAIEDVDFSDKGNVNVDSIVFTTVK